MAIPYSQMITGRRQESAVVGLLRGATILPLRDKSNVVAIKVRFAGRKGTWNSIKDFNVNCMRCMRFCGGDLS